MAAFTDIPEIQLKDLHFETLEWKSNLQFVEGEVNFINQLLNSYIFEPTTPNLFERLEEYREKIKKIEQEIIQFDRKIQKHESELGGMMECDTISCEADYVHYHKELGHHFNSFYKRFNTLKSQVFSYAGSILKKNKSPY